MQKGHIDTGMSEIGICELVTVVSKLGSEVETNGPNHQTYTVSIFKFRSIVNVCFRKLNPKMHVFYRKFIELVIFNAFRI